MNVSVFVEDNFQESIKFGSYSRFEQKKQDVRVKIYNFYHLIALESCI